MNRSLQEKLLLALAPLVLGACAGMEERERVVAFQPDPSLPFDRCVPLTRIDRTEVLDEQNVLFYMRGGGIFRNWLPRRCPGLNDRDAFSYRTTLGKLCDSDTITVIDPMGMGSIQGASCRLGGFYPTSELEADALKNEIERIRELGIDF